MDITTTLSWADTAWTVAQIALFVGCPTAGVGWLTVTAALRIAGKVAVKRAIRKALLHAAVAGATATAAASAYVLSHSGGGGGGSASNPGMGLPQTVLSRETSVIELKPDSDGHPFIEIDGEKIDKADLVKRLLAQKGFGHLRELTLHDKLEGKHGEWQLHVRSVAEQLSLPVLSPEVGNE